MSPRDATIRLYRRPPLSLPGSPPLTFLPDTLGGVSDDRIKGLERVMAERADTGFGDVEFVSGHTLQPFSRASTQAADNLLGKALDALLSDDHDRAERLVGRVARMRHDDHEDTAPGALAGHMMLFDLVADELEDSAEGDSRWLDAAIHVLENTNDLARFELRDTLTVIAQDYHVDSAELTRLRRAVAPVPERAELIDLRLDVEEPGRHIHAILHACQQYLEALGSVRPDRRA